MSDTLEYITAAASILAAFATAWAAIAASLSSQSARQAVELQQRSEKSREDLQKKELLISKFQLLIGDFGEIKAVAEDVWSPDRGELLRELDRKIRKQHTIIKSLSPDIGRMLDEWSFEKIEGCTNSMLLTDTLGNKNANIGNRYDKFFYQKSEHLRMIQDEIFKN